MTIKKYYLPIVFGLGFATQAIANIPNTNHPSTFLGPSVGATIANTMNDNSAYAAGLDLSTASMRLNGTMALQFESTQRFKVSLELLRQDLTYAFFSGNTSQWQNQFTLGGNYRFYFEDYTFDPQAGFDLYYLRSQSNRIRTITGTYYPGGSPTAFSNTRKIAGATSWGMAPGLSLRLWPGGRVGVTVNYDNNQYDTSYVSNEDAKGFGGTFSAQQALADNVTLNFLAGFLQAYNDYEASVDFSNLPFYGNWTIGIGGNYTIGKNTMPSSYNIGLTINFIPGDPGLTAISAISARENMLAWTSRSAAYHPQVLGVRDQLVT